jgi:hypothetical protein
MNRFFWPTAAMTALSALVSVGYSITAVAQNGLGEIYALYALSRSVALVPAVGYAIAKRSTTALAATALAMSLIQLIDAWIGSVQHDSAKTFGPLAFAIINFALLALFMRGNKHPQGASS